MRLLLFLITILFVRQSLAAELSLNPYYSYGTSNFFGQDQVPTYNGSTYGAEIEFRSTFKSWGLGFFGAYSIGEFDNTKNDSEQKETLENKLLIGGFKVYFSNLFFKLGYGSLDVEDQSTGTVTKTLELEGAAFVVGFGLHYKFSSRLGVFFGIDVIQSEFDPSFGGVTQATSYINYNGVVGITIQIPSGSNGPSKSEQGNKNGFEL